MSLRDNLKKKSASLVKRRTVTLPETQEEVEIRGLMMGQVNRVTDQKGQAKQVRMQIALSTFDPQTGEQVWNADHQPDAEEIDALPTPDGLLIVNVSNELSGIGEAAEALGKAISLPGSGDSTSSPTGSESPSENSVSESVGSNS